MASKYQQQAKATKKKRKVSKLGQAMKAQRKLTPARKKALTLRQQQMRKQSLLKSRKQRAGLYSATKRKLTPAEQRRMKILGAKATTAKAKASAAAMDKRIAKIKKGK